MALTNPANEAKSCRSKSSLKPQPPTIYHQLRQSQLSHLNRQRLLQHIHGRFSPMRRSLERLVGPRLTPQQRRLCQVAKEHQLFRSSTVTRPCLCPLMKWILLPLALSPPWLVIMLHDN